MGNVNYRLMTFMIAFWLILPIPFQFMGISDADRLDYSFLEEQNEKPSALEVVNFIIDIVWNYLKILFLGISGTGNIIIMINIFLWIMRLITMFMFIVALRG